MNWDNLKDSWRARLSDVRERWNRLDDSELAAIEGNRTRLVERIRSKYGIDAQEAERQVETWEHSQDHRDERRAAQEEVPAPEAHLDSGGGTKLHGDKLSQPATLDDEATDRLRESTRPGETQRPRDSGTAPSQTQADPQVSRRRKTERRGE